ncbi:hypothetical protein CY658_04785 [Variovorax sp. RO1]|uniref:hypothetical protein n=1 Tax=Variovorax sp. RO1 TaxID=2066034 RepID=UPI000C7172EC|nr:hypothetical protein [Variovorax sp. RO1]PLC06352.1 hypothetical protein CY658_04785 [Variovorax sp. RO1]
MNFDHGILNLPLAKRQGNIDAQIDKYKANKAREEAAARRAASKLLAAQRLEAKRILNAMTPERVAELAAKTKSTPSTVRRALKSMVYFQPAKFIKSEGQPS